MKPFAILFFFVVAACVVGTLALLDSWERIQVWVRRQLRGPLWTGRTTALPVTVSGAEVLDADSLAAAQTKAAPLMFLKKDRKSDKAHLMGHKPAFQPAKIAAKLGSFLSFLWRWKLPLLVVVFFIVGMSTLRGCTPEIGKSADTLRFERELAEAEAETQAAINARDAVIAQAAQDAALSRERIQQASQRGRDAIEAATPENEAPLDPELVRAFRLALDELCIVRADGSRADTCGPSA